MEDMEDSIWYSPIRFIRVYICMVYNIVYFDKSYVINMILFQEEVHAVVYLWETA